MEKKGFKKEKEVGKVGKLEVRSGINTFLSCVLCNIYLGKVNSLK